MFFDFAFLIFQCLVVAMVVRVPPTRRPITLSVTVSRAPSASRGSVVRAHPSVAVGGTMAAAIATSVNASVTFEDTAIIDAEPRSREMTRSRRVGLVLIKSSRVGGIVWLVARSDALVVKVAVKATSRRIASVARLSRALFLGPRVRDTAKA